MTRIEDPVLRRLTHLPWGLAGSLAVLVVGGVVGWLVRGGPGAAGVAAGTVLVVVSFTLSSLVIAIADSVRPALVLPFGLMTYVVKFSAFGVMMAGIAKRGWSGLAPMGFGIVATAVVWSAAQILWLVRTQHPYRPAAPGRADPGEHPDAAEPG